MMSLHSWVSLQGLRVSFTLHDEPPLQGKPPSPGWTSMHFPGWASKAKDEPPWSFDECLLRKCGPLKLPSDLRKTRLKIIKKTKCIFCCAFYICFVSKTKQMLLFYFISLKLVVLVLDLSWFVMELNAGICFYSIFFNTKQIAVLFFIVFSPKNCFKSVRFVLILKRISVSIYL